MTGPSSVTHWPCTIHSPPSESFFSIKLAVIFPKYQSCPGHIYITYDKPVPAGAGQDGGGEKFNESRPSHLDLKELTGLWSGSC